jgi:hypothetical protein
MNISKLGELKNLESHLANKNSQKNLI